VTAKVHRDRNLDRQCQRLQVVLFKALMPHRQGILAELHRLDMGATQLQSPHLLDYEIPQLRIARIQEPVVRFEMLKGQVVDDVIVGVIRVSRTRSREQHIDS
jgi:hypothetical protein